MASAKGRSHLKHFQLAYLSAVETDVKTVFSFEPRPCTTAMIATEMPAAMSPYSMAVAAVSSSKKEDMRFFIANSFFPTQGNLRYSYSIRLDYYQCSTMYFHNLSCLTIVIIGNI